MRPAPPTPPDPGPCRSLLRAPDWAWWLLWPPNPSPTPPPSQRSSPAVGSGGALSLPRALSKHQGSHMWDAIGLGPPMGLLDGATTSH